MYIDLDNALVILLHGLKVQWQQQQQQQPSRGQAVVEEISPPGTLIDPWEGLVDEADDENAPASAVVEEETSTTAVSEMRLISRVGSFPQTFTFMISAKRAVLACLVPWLYRSIT